MAANDRSPARDEFYRLEALEERIRQDAMQVYRPQVQQQAIHMSCAIEMIVRGGKRSGKTVSVVNEFGSRVLGQQLFNIDGSKFPLRFPVSTPEDPRLYWIIGWDNKHIGQTIYHKLFSPGLYRVIKDLVTKQWRVFNEANPSDRARKKESKPAGPVIPPRMIDQNSWVWTAPAANVFESVRLKNGAMICAYPSSARSPKMGDSVDGIWIDEDVQNASHVKEWQDRLTDRGGWLMWSAWPQNSNPAMIRLLQRADAEEREKPAKRRIQSFQLIMTQNEFIPDENKQDALERMESDEEIARRDRGETLMEQLTMYDFNPMIHVVKKIEHPSLQGAKGFLERYLFKHNHLPPDFTRYLSIDPSHTRTAVALAAVPPPIWKSIDGREIHFGNLIIIEAELVARRMIAADLAAAVAELVKGLNLEAMVMDQNAGRQTHAGRDESTSELYETAFREKLITSRTTKSGFVPGCNEPPLRYSTMRKYLKATYAGQASLLFVGHRTVQTLREFQTYTKKTQVDLNGDLQIFDQPANPRIHDCMAAVEYLVTYINERFTAGNAYVEPEEFKGTGSAAYHYIQAKMKQRSEALGQSVHLGPGSQPHAA